MTDPNPLHTQPADTEKDLNPPTEEKAPVTPVTSDPQGTTVAESHFPYGATEGEDLGAITANFGEVYRTLQGGLTHNADYEKFRTWGAEPGDIPAWVSLQRENPEVHFKPLIDAGCSPERARSYLNKEHFSTRIYDEEQLKRFATIPLPFLQATPENIPLEKLYELLKKAQPLIDSNNLDTSQLPRLATIGGEAFLNTAQQLGITWLRGELLNQVSSGEELKKYHTILTQAESQEVKGDDLSSIIYELHTRNVSPERFAAYVQRPIPKQFIEAYANPNTPTPSHYTDCIYLVALNIPDETLQQAMDANVLNPYDIACMPNPEKILPQIKRCANAGLKIGSRSYIRAGFFGLDLWDFTARCYEKGVMPDSETAKEMKDDEYDEYDDLRLIYRAYNFLENKPSEEVSQFFTTWRTYKNCYPRLKPSEKHTENFIPCLYQLHQDHCTAQDINKALDAGIKNIETLIVFHNHLPEFSGYQKVLKNSNIQIPEDGSNIQVNSFKYHPANTIEYISCALFLHDPRISPELMEGFMAQGITSIEDMCELVKLDADQQKRTILEKKIAILTEARARLGERPTLEEPSTETTDAPTETSAPTPAEAHATPDEAPSQTPGPGNLEWRLKAVGETTYAALQAAEEHLARATAEIATLRPALAAAKDLVASLQLQMSFEEGAKNKALARVTTLEAELKAAREDASFIAQLPRDFRYQQGGVLTPTISPFTAPQHTLLENISKTITTQNQALYPQTIALFRHYLEQARQAQATKWINYFTQYLSDLEIQKT